MRESRVIHRWLTAERLVAKRNFAATGPDARGWLRADASAPRSGARWGLEDPLRAHRHELLGGASGAAPWWRRSRPWSRPCAWRWPPSARSRPHRRRARDSPGRDRLRPSTTSFISIRSSRPDSVCFRGRKRDLVDIDLGQRSRAMCSGRPTVPISGVENTAVGMSSWSTAVGLPPNTVRRRRGPRGSRPASG